MCHHPNKHWFEENSTACEICDWINQIPQIPTGYRLRCERCGHLLYSHYPQLALQLWLNSAIAVIMFILSFCFSFLGFASNGVERHISLIECIVNLSVEHHPLLGIIVTLPLIVFPFLYLCFVILLLLMIKSHQQLPLRLYGMVHLLESLKPWLMVDVFLLGALVAIVKLQSLAQIELGHSFWAFCCFALLLIRIVSLVDKRWFWNQLKGKSEEITYHHGTARSQQLTGCQFCGALVPHNEKSCPRCHHLIHSRKKNSLSKTCALLCAASILYIPANLYPIMITTFLGQAEPSTIIGGIILLWEMHSYPVALVILAASIIVPLAKILSLFWLCWNTKFKTHIPPAKKQKIYHITEFVGKWSMVDVFVVAILAALVQLGTLMNIIPGRAALSFSFVVILTMLAAFSFDPRLIWDVQEKHDAPEQ
ncbi:PqiA/YebS family transporter subunit [Vibrio salinus]|uniref:PqiA/YebS family transporter subunit n=1 Tax=Vibrio salinus TaxID=2899784 RepID=UPI001E2877AB|nr:PqiA/YebS family transporter subunit [Vibrio salinus]MCE0494830.1 PqiA/YebS family transporter subunit [Vibrio salinus]